jgi:hypothetical protein
MPDKIYACRKTRGCSRCWRNRIKHACPAAKRFLKNHPEFVQEMEAEKKLVWCAWGGDDKKKVNTRKKERKFLK